MNMQSEKRKPGRPRKHDSLFLELEDVEEYLEYDVEDLPDNSITPNVYEHMFGDTEFDMRDFDMSEEIGIRFNDLPIMIPNETIYPNIIKQPVWLRNLIRDASRIHVWDKKQIEEEEQQNIYKAQVNVLIKKRVESEKAIKKRQAEKEELRKRRHYFTEHIPLMAHNIKIVEVQSSNSKFLLLKKEQKIKNLACYRCDSRTITDCECSDINERLRKVCCGPDACVLEKWCVICDRHEIFCTCKFKYGSRMIPQYLFYGWYLREDWYKPLEAQYYSQQEDSNA